MNELDLIRSFRSEMPRAECRGQRPRRAGLAAARAAPAALGSAGGGGRRPRGGRDGGRPDRPVQGRQPARHAVGQRRRGRSRQPPPRSARRRAAALRRVLVRAPADPVADVRRGDRDAIIQPQVREDWAGVDGARRWRIRQDGEPRFPGVHETASAGRRPGARCRPGRPSTACERPAGRRSTTAPRPSPTRSCSLCHAIPRRSTGACTTRRWSASAATGWTRRRS